MRAAALLHTDDEAARRHHELIAEIKALRTLVEPKDDAQRILETYQAQLSEMQKLKGELVIIHNAIIRTKQEIATLHTTGFHGQNMSRMTHELDAVVSGTEQATQSILRSAEDIDQTAGTLAGALKSAHEQGLAHDIRDRVVGIYEACNFQDISGQRINKAMATLKAAEACVARAMEILGGVDGKRAARKTNTMLNGPKLDGDGGHANQHDIDRMFA